MLMSVCVLPVYDGAKVERVSEVLQLPVIVEGRRPLALELQPLEKLDFLRGRRAAERRILEEFLEPGLLADRLFGFPLDKLESRSEEHTSELQSQSNLVCRLLLEKKKNTLSLYSIMGVL